MKTKEYWTTWAKAAAIRAVKTIAETALASITMGSAIYEINWGHTASVAVVAGIISLLMSVKGLPEVPKSPEVK